MVSNVRSCDLAKPRDLETIGIADPVEFDFMLGNRIMAEQVYLKREIIPVCYRFRVGVNQQFKAIEKLRCIFIRGADSKSAIVPVVRRQYAGLIVFPRVRRDPVAGVVRVFLILYIAL